MQTLRLRLLPLLAVLSTLTLGACSILTTAPTDVPLSGAAVASAIGHVRPSKNDTCETQVQVAAQSSRIATFQTGKETVYKPACSAPAPVGPAEGGLASGKTGRPKAPGKDAPGKLSPASLPHLELEPWPPLIPPRTPEWHERQVTAAAN